MSRLSCSQQPFEYVSAASRWEAGASWWTCFVSTRLCRSLDSAVVSLPLLNQFTSLHRELVVKAAIVEGGNADMIVAHAAVDLRGAQRVGDHTPRHRRLPRPYAFSVVATFPFFLANELIRLAIQGVIIMSHTD